MPGMRRHDSPPVRRGFDLRDVKALDTDGVQGRFSGYLAVFNNTDLQGDSIQPGAFAKSLNDLKARQQQRAGTPGGRYLFPIYWNHNADHPCGGFLDAREDANGLYVEGELDLDTETGCKAYSAIAKGYVPAMSIGYFVVRYAYDRDGTRLLRELALFEGSLVANPANPEALIMEVKSASQDDKDAQAARAKKYGIAVKDGGNVTKPSQWANLSDADFGDPTNYRFPMPDKAHADNAAARFGDPDTRKEYSSKEQGIIDKRIAKRQASFGESSDDDSKGKSMTRKPARKARDFQTVYNTDREAADLLEDLDDLWEALRESICSVLIEGSSSDGDSNTLGDSLDQFSTAVTSWVQMAEMQDCWGDIADSSDDMAGYIADSATQAVNGSYYYMAMNIARSESKAGRTISQANADAMQKALDMCADGHKAAAKGVQMARAGHKAMSNLLAKMQPGASTDDDTTDDDDGNDGTGNKPGKQDNGKSLHTSDNHAPGAPQGDTTQPLETAQPVTADEISRIIQRKMQAARMAAALGTQQSA